MFVRKTKTLAASGQISAAGMAARLIFLIFTGATAGDSINLANGSGGTSLTGSLLVPANGNVVLGPFAKEDAPVFSADIYATITKTGAATVFAVYEELE